MPMKPDRPRLVHLAPLIEGRHQQHRNPAPPRVAPHPPQNVHAPHARHHQIQDHAIRAQSRLQRRQRRRAVPSLVHVVPPALDHLPHHVAGDLVIIHQKYGGHVTQLLNARETRGRHYLRGSNRRSIPQISGPNR
jgi:hypothetical protein